MSSEPDHWSERCDERPLENALEAKGLSSTHMPPVGTVWWLGGRCGMIRSGGQSDEDQEKATHSWLGPTSSNTLPGIYSLFLWIPNGALCEEIPVKVNFPDPCGIADYGRHN